ncbi:MAG: hypothetical protein JXR63_05850 [Spirochaetales bacterium]|nr:hypothetical protein [Spirochaetales bacterium]
MFRNRVLLVAIMVAVMLVSCQSKTLSPFESAGLRGMIYDADNKPNPSVKITVSRLESETLDFKKPRVGVIPKIEYKEISVFSDFEGRFLFPDMAPGLYKVVVAKPDYEGIEFEFEFMSRTQFIYLNILSFNQLVRKAKEVLAEDKFKDAEFYLKRAESIRQDDDVLQYIRAVSLYRQKEDEKALEVLAAMLRRNDYTFVHLLMADIYEYRLYDVKKALYHLSVFLKYRGDLDIEVRYNNLKGEINEENSKKN